MHQCNEYLESIFKNPPKDENMKRLYSNIKQIYHKRLNEQTKKRKVSKKQTKIFKKQTISNHYKGIEVCDTTIEFNCYICKNKTSIQNAHFFHKYLCNECGSINYEKRSFKVDLTGKIAIVTGGRVKIGYEIVLKLLRMNCKVITTSRFPTDTLERYSNEKDYEDFKNRLIIKIADFRFRSSIDFFIINEFKSIDILINNACQTIWKPDIWYKSLIEKEKTNLICNSNKEEIEINHQWFPIGQYDEFNQQIDLRPINSWVETIETVDVNELLENQIINCTIPFLLIQKLTPLLKKTNQDWSFIINVSSMEGIFDKSITTPRHVHTNIAKAGLNMITRSISIHYKKTHRILINSVDTGWVTQEFPHGHPKQDMKPPLDCIDGAARVIDPILLAIDNNILFSGVFLKDFKPSNW